MCYNVLCKVCRQLPMMPCCTSEVLNIPTNNCHHIYSKEIALHPRYFADIMTEQTFPFPGYYWTTADNGSTIQVYCDFESEQFSQTTAEIDNIEHNTCPIMERECAGDNSGKYSASVDSNIFHSSSLYLSNQWTSSPLPCQQLSSGA